MPQIARLWPLWILVTLALTAQPFGWHLAYFRSPGSAFLPVYLVALAVLGLATVAYLRVRRPVWEPRLLAGFFLAFFLFYEPLPTLYTLWILFVCFGLGRLLLGRVAETTAEQLTLWPAAGLGLASAAMFVLGLARLYYRWVVIALLAAGALLFWRNAARLWELWRRADAVYARVAGSPRAGCAGSSSSCSAWPVPWWF